MHTVRVLGACLSGMSAEIIGSPTTRSGRVMASIRGLVFGQPLRSEAELTERLPIWKALPARSRLGLTSMPAPA